MPEDTGNSFASRMTSVIQWESALFYSYEAEVDGEPVELGDERAPDRRDMVLSIIRHGSLEGRASCQWQTFEMSAQPGAHYTHVDESWVTFEDGEWCKEVVVEVFNRPRDFEGTLEVGLYIVEKTVEGARPGKYLHTSGLKIIDIAFFPTNDLRQWVQGGDASRIGAINPFLLVFKFLMFCWSLPACRCGTIKEALYWQYVNLCEIQNLMILFFLVEVLVDQDISNDAKKLAAVQLGLLWVVTFMLTAYLSYRRDFWGLSTGITKHLKMLLFKKFLSYDQSTRSSLPDATLIMGMTRDVVTAVDFGYVYAVQIVFKSAAKILYLTAAMVYIQTRLGSFDVYPLVVVGVVPPAVAAFLVVRQQGAFERINELFSSENIVVSYLIKTITAFEVVSAYEQRTKTEFQMADYVDRHNLANRTMKAYSTFSRSIVPCLMTPLLGFYIIRGSFRVIEEVDLNEFASFISNIAILREIGGDLQAAYDLCVQVSAVRGSLAPRDAIIRPRALTIFHRPTFILVYCPQRLLDPCARLRGY